MAEDTNCHTVTNKNEKFLTKKQFRLHVVTVEFVGDLGSGLRRGKPTAPCS